MKKLQIVILALFFCIGFYSCSKENHEADETTIKKLVLKGDFIPMGGNQSLCRTHDNKYVIIALKKQSHELYVAMLSSSLSLLWEKTYGTNYSRYAGIIESADGGLVISANKNVSNTDHPEDCCLELLKLTPSGDLLWDKKYWFDKYEIGFVPILETSDKGLITLVLCASPEDSLHFYPTLFKVDQYGDSLWLRGNTEHFNCVGNTLKSAPGNDILISDVCAFYRTDSMGYEKWEQHSLSWSVGFAVIEDGSAAVLRTQYVDTGYVSQIVMLDVNGQILWKNNQIHAWDLSVGNLYQSQDNGFAFIARTDGIVKEIKTDDRGNKKSEKILEGSEISGFVPSQDKYCCYTTKTNISTTSCDLIISLVE